MQVDAEYRTIPRAYNPGSVILGIGIGLVAGFFGGNLIYQKNLDQNCACQDDDPQNGEGDKEDLQKKIEEQDRKIQGLIDACCKHEALLMGLKQRDAIKKETYRLEFVIEQYDRVYRDSQWSHSRFVWKELLRGQTAEADQYWQEQSSSLDADKYLQEPLDELREMIKRAVETLKKEPTKETRVYEDPGD